MNLLKHDVYSHIVHGMKVTGFDLFWQHRVAERVRDSLLPAQGQFAVVSVSGVKVSGDMLAGTFRVVARLVLSMGPPYKADVPHAYKLAFDGKRWYVQIGRAG